MKKKDIITGTVERIDFPNIGMVRPKEDKSAIVRVKNAIPGQEVKVRIQKARKGQLEGGLLEILSNSPLESKPDFCPHFGLCGGCLYGGFSYEDEVKIKGDQVRRLLEPVLGKETFDSVYQGIEKSPADEEYRNKMEFSFGDEYKDGPLALGMHKRGAFYDIVSVTGCRIVDEDFRLILGNTLKFFTERKVSFFNRNTHEGFLRHLLVRKASFTGEILLSLVTSSQMDKEIVSEWADMIKALPFKGALAGILHTVNDRISDVVEDQGTSILFEQDYFYERLLSLKFKISPFSFFQTNSRGAERLYEIIKSLTPKSGVVYDLYSGTGTIAQIVSPSAGEVVGVEIVKEAVIAAGENAKINNIENVRFLCGDVLKVLDEIKTPPDMIILDPPREGVNPKALKKILSYGVEEIIYVSCKPTSLKRDIPEFFNFGYVPTFIKAVDMFPKTANVEVIAHFKRK